MMSKTTNLSGDKLINELKVVEKKTIDLLGRYRNDIVVIRSNDEFIKYIDQVIDIKVVSIDTETNNSLDPLTCKLMGLCLYAPGLKQAYIPVNHRNPITKIRLDNQVSEEQISVQLKRIVDSGVGIVMHNGKFDYEVLKCTTGVKVVPHWDTMIAAKLLNENESASLKDQYIKKVDPTHNRATIDKLFSTVKYSDVDPNIFALYAATDAYMTYQLFYKQHEQMFSVGNEKINNLFYNIEMPMIEIVAEMELYGVRADLKYCDKLRIKYETIISKIDEAIFKELELLSDVFEHWKASNQANKLEEIFVSAKEESKLDLVDLVRKFPQMTSNGKRYKYGKRYVDLISEPINLNSSKQLSVLFYRIFGAISVDSHKPTGTSKHELPLLIKKFEFVKNNYKSLVHKFFDTYESEKEYEIMKLFRLEQYFDMSCIIFENTEEEIKKGKERLNHIIKICESIVSRSGYKKLLSTFVNPVPSLVNHWSDHKVRFHLNSLGARTGRFTSGGTWKFYEEDEVEEEDVVLHGMNSQNIPTNTSKEIRLMFLADEGRVFIGADWSQQEPKITAFLSQEDKMIEAFEEGKDIYAIIAQMVFGGSYEDNLEFKDKEKTVINPEGKKRRKVGKTIILATMYGMSASSVATMLKMSDEDAEMILNKFFEKFIKLSKCKDDTVISCKKFGYVEDVLGRRRRLPDIQLPLYRVRFVNSPSLSLSEANELLKKYFNRVNDSQLTKKELNIIRKEAKNNNIVIESNEDLINKAIRQAFNARIQGSAATMAKKTMKLLYDDPVLRKHDVHLVFQIHDELIVDCPIEHVEIVKNRLKRIMEKSALTIGITVPMKCDIEVENRWGEATITSEIQEVYLDFVSDGVENPFEKLCEKYSNFPGESLRKVIDGESDRLLF